MVQLLCISYSCWLALRCERGRLCGLLVGLGLPGPILRVMASRPLTVVEVRGRGGAGGSLGLALGQICARCGCGERSFYTGILLPAICKTIGLDAPQSKAVDGVGRLLALQQDVACRGSLAVWRIQALLQQSLFCRGGFRHHGPWRLLACTALT